MCSRRSSGGRTIRISQIERHLGKVSQISRPIFHPKFGQACVLHVIRSQWCHAPSHVYILPSGGACLPRHLSSWKHSSHGALFPEFAKPSHSKLRVRTKPHSTSRSFLSSYRRTLPRGTQTLEIQPRCMATFCHGSRLLRSLVITLYCQHSPSAQGRMDTLSCNVLGLPRPTVFSHPWTARNHHGEQSVMAIPRDRVQNGVPRATVSIPGCLFISDIALHQTPSPTAVGTSSRHAPQSAHFYWPSMLHCSVYRSKALGWPWDSWWPKSSAYRSSIGRHSWKAWPAAKPNDLHPSVGQRDSAFGNAAFQKLASFASHVHVWKSLRGKPTPLYNVLQPAKSNVSQQTLVSLGSNFLEQCPNIQTVRIYRSPVSPYSRGDRRAFHQNGWDSDDESHISKEDLIPPAEVQLSEDAIQDLQELFMPWHRWCPHLREIQLWHSFVWRKASHTDVWARRTLEMMDRRKDLFFYWPTWRLVFAYIPPHLSPYLTLSVNQRRILFTPPQAFLFLSTLIQRLSVFSNTFGNAQKILLS